MKIFRGSLKLLWERFLEEILLRRQFEKMYLILGGHIFFQTLSAAVQIDLFTLLARQGPLTRSQIASLLKIEEKPARILLLGCTALGLLKKRGEAYSNSILAAEVLDRDKPRNIASIVAWQHFINYRPMHAFCEAVKTNRNVGLDTFSGAENTLYERLTHHPELEKVFQDAMESISVQANRLLSETVDFGGFRHLLDVGGGNGANAIMLAQKYPALKATVFDSASVCHIAHENILKAGLADRIDAKDGNCFTDSFPPGPDVILFCHFMTIWSEQKNRELLKKSFYALPPGGAVVIFNMMQSDDESGPLSSAMGSPYFLTLATGEGMLYTWSEYETWLREAGFSSVFRRKLVRDHGVIIGVK